MPPEKLLKAEKMAIFAHLGQKRTGGEPFCNHVIEVSKKLKQAGAPIYVQVAGLLHDTIEDTTITEDVLMEEYGEEVTVLVQGVTKDQITYYPDKLRLYTKINPWTLIMKMADRIHNLETVECFKYRRRLKYYKETTQILMPLFEEASKNLPWRVRKVYYTLKPKLEYLVNHYPL